MLDTGTAEAMPLAGILNTIEFRFPISPRLALILNWRDVPDDQPVLEGKTHHLRTINQSVRDQAEEHWFRQPGTTTPYSSGPQDPISFELFSDYDLDQIAQSNRRREVDAALTDMIETDEANRKLRIKVSERPVIERATPPRSD